MMLADAEAERTPQRRGLAPTWRKVLQLYRKRSFSVYYAGASCQKAVSCRQLREMGLKSLPYQLGHYM